MRTVSENIRSEQPNLVEFQRLILKRGDVAVYTILVHALNELKDLVNVGKNLTNAQISYLANRIMSSYWFLKFEEIKFVIYRAVERERLFDRLDPNIVLGWFADYDSERTEVAMRLSDQEASQQQFGYQPSADAITWPQYVESLWNLAMYADAEAVEKLVQIQSMTESRMRLTTKEQSRENEISFKQFFYQHYLKKKQ